MGRGASGERVVLETTAERSNDLRLALLRALFADISPREDGTLPEEELLAVLDIVERAAAGEPPLEVRVTAFVDRERARLVEGYARRAQAHLLNEEYLLSPVALALLERLDRTPLRLAHEWDRTGRYRPWLENIALFWGQALWYD